MKVLLELRPALDGHGGIPQETRLLFAGLARLRGVEVAGLIQSSNLAIEPGIPVDHSDTMSAPQRIDRLSRVVVSLQQGPMSSRVESVRRRLLGRFGPVFAALKSSLGGRVPLTRFDPQRFGDFIWRSFFARTLSHERFETVTSRDFRVLRWPWSAAHAVGVISSLFGRAMYPRIDTRGTDVFVAETPYPGRVARGTALVVRYHDAIPLFMPHTIRNRGFHRAMHFEALKRNAADGAWFACVSETTRQDLLAVMPDIADRCVTIANMIAPGLRCPPDGGEDRVEATLWSCRNREAPCGGGALLPLATGRQSRRYLLMVSTIEPRKNHAALLDAWSLARSSGHPDLELVCVGGLGWEHGPILDRFRPWLERGGIHLLHDVPAAELALLYRHAEVTVCPSFGEGFDFSGVEAMHCGGIVVASDIPVHREVYADAASYFPAYSHEALAEAVAALLGEAGAERRRELTLAGRRVAARYTEDEILPHWGRFLEQVARASAQRAPGPALP